MAGLSARTSQVLGSVMDLLAAASGQLRSKGGKREKMGMGWVQEGQERGE